MEREEAEKYVSTLTETNKYASTSTYIVRACASIYSTVNFATGLNFVVTGA
jgi:hypothetical protein